jgi:hypothetical protein
MIKRLVGQLVADSVVGSFGSLAQFLATGDNFAPAYKKMPDSLSLRSLSVQATLGISG